MTARYICIEGCEGVGKTTQVGNLVDFLRTRGYRVLETKEPGTYHSPLTMELRNIMLNAKYDGHLTQVARELISQAIRSVHLERVIAPAMEQYDFIVQDRGMLSGLAYGHACGNSLMWIEELLNKVCSASGLATLLDVLYDDVIYLKGDTSIGLKRALVSKQEFADGDSIEKKGDNFILEVSSKMDEYSTWFKTKTVDVTDKTIDQVFNEIVVALSLGGK